MDSQITDETLTSPKKPWETVAEAARRVRDVFAPTNVSKLSTKVWTMLSKWFHRGQADNTPVDTQNVDKASTARDSRRQECDSASPCASCKSSKAATDVQAPLPRLAPVTRQATTDRLQAKPKPTSAPPQRPLGVKPTSSVPLYAQPQRERREVRGEEARAGPAVRGQTVRQGALRVSWRAVGTGARSASEDRTLGWEVRLAPRESVAGAGRVAEAAGRKGRAGMARRALSGSKTRLPRLARIPEEHHTDTDTDPPANVNRDLAQTSPTPAGGSSAQLEGKSGLSTSTRDSAPSPLLSPRPAPAIGPHQAREDKTKSAATPAETVPEKTTSNVAGGGRLQTRKRGGGSNEKVGAPRSPVSSELDWGVAVATVQEEGKEKEKKRVRAEEEEEAGVPSKRMRMLQILRSVCKPKRKRATTKRVQRRNM